MGLVKCEKCGELFSDSYVECPFCTEDEEYYQNSIKEIDRGPRRNWQAVLIPVVCVLLAAFLGGMWHITRNGFQWRSERRPANQTENVSTAETEDTEDGQQEETVEVVLVMDKTLELAPEESKTISISGGSSYKWVSSDPAVASVNSNGVARGIREGSAIITATDSSGATALCSVTVEEKADEPEKEPEETGEKEPAGTATKPVKPLGNIDMGKLEFHMPGSNGTGPKNKQP